MFPDRKPPACPGDDWPSCFVDARFDDPKALGYARAFASDHLLAGVLPEQDMDGGWRGHIHLVPEVPRGDDAKQLLWIDGALHELAHDFLDGVRARASPRAVAYRVDFIAFRFFRSVKRTTPSAFADTTELGGASTWTVGYNLAGSLLGSERGARETLFHEIFHLNDAAHGNWSERALAATFQAVVDKCGKKTSCLRPYAPSDTQVRNGTYYAFQPGNGVVEYAAELALRYYLETRAALRHEKFGKPAFKCGPRENAVAWAAIKDEFFGGADLTAPCP